MNRFVPHRRVALALVALGILGLALPASAGNLVPFKGNANVVITSPPTSPLLTASGTGQATHMGLFTRTERLAPNADGTFTGRLVFTAANGDQLSASIAGRFTPLGTAVGTYTFTGGTGRFRSASGRAAFSAVPTGPGQFAITFEGAIGF